MERLVPQSIDWAVRSNNMTGNPIVFIPIHKGADGFMSDADFKELYWPTFKAVLLGLIEQGLVPWVFVEGSYNERLEVIADEDIPAHRMIWMFDATDMERAKAVVGKRQCIGGNVPAALFAMGTPEEMDAYVKDLLGKTAPGRRLHPQQRHRAGRGRPGRVPGLHRGRAQVREVSCEPCGAALSGPKRGVDGGGGPDGPPPPFFVGEAQAPGGRGAGGAGPGVADEGGQRLLVHAEHDDVDGERWRRRPCRRRRR